MIANLPDYKDGAAYYDEPLLEYVIKGANKFWRNNDEEGEWDSNVPRIFGKRCCKGLINTSRQEKYLASTEVQDTIRAFGLDATKFWYLCLCIKDYVEGYTIAAPVMNISPREELKNLVAELDKMQPTFNPNFIKVTNNGELTLKVDKHPVRIKEGQTLSLISVALKDFLAKNDGLSNLLDTASIDFEDTAILSPIKQLYLFDYYLSSFLKDLIADKTIESTQANRKISYDKRLLVSRMIYVLGLSNDKRFNTEYSESGDKSNFLKNYLSKCKNVEIPTHNKYYW